MLFCTAVRHDREFLIALMIITPIVIISISLSIAASQAGLRTLHGLGPQLRRAISGQLGSDDDELFLKEDASQKAQVNHIYMNTSGLTFFCSCFSWSVTPCFDVFAAQGILGES